MTRILHLSDLHFGFHRQSLVEPLLARINRAAADLVVVTGDLTHRGRPGQYGLAADFLSRITAPVLSVPGNHDVPLYNIPVRFLIPWRGYRLAINPDLDPTGVAGRVRVLGLNSVDPFAWQRGVIRDGEIARLTASLDPLAVNIVALHHPLQHMPGVDKELAARAPQLLRRLEAAGVSMVFSGHLHVWSAANLLDHGHRRILQVQAGTALCARESDRQNEFAVLDIDGDEAVIHRHVAPMAQDDFDPPQTLRLSRAGGAWRLVEGSEPEPILPGATETAFSTA